MLVCCSFVLTACFTSVSEIKVEGFKTTYAVGEHLDLTDVKVVVCYSNGDETTVDAKPSMFSGFDTTTEGKKTLVVTYEYESVEITYTVEPKNYSVNISLNNSSYGSLSVDNEKAKYDYGETINITVTPNAGYYLRSYSDCDCKELTRTIVVDRDLDITVNLKQGEGCNFFGYYLAVENDLNEKTMQNTEGNTSWYIKFLPNKTFTTSKLTLECQDINKFSCWVNNINEMLTKGQSRSFTQTINNVEYTITFVYSSN